MRKGDNMNRTEICRKANSIIAEKRLTAEIEADKREKEVYEKLPAVAEARKKLAKTASELSRIIILRGNNFKDSFEKIHQNQIKCKNIIKSELINNGYPEDYLDVHYSCTECSDTGYMDNEMCDCMKKLISKLSCEELNRSANMPEADFSHFDLRYYSGLNIDGINCYDKMKKNYNFCVHYAEKFSTSSKNILILGKTGVGKTHLSMAVAKQVAIKGFDVIYGSVLNLIRSIEKEHFCKSGEANDTLDMLCRCDLLIFDDLGAEYHTSFTESLIYDLINTRINIGLPTIISANLSLEELNNRYNERIISRIAGYYEILFCIGKDIRQLKNFRRN